MSYFGESCASYNLNSDFRSVAEREEYDNNSMRRSRILEQRYAYENKKKALDAFASESKDFLLTESLFYIMKKCFPVTLESSLLDQGRSVISSFVKEEGTESLLSKFKTKTLFLSELAYIVESTHKKVLHSCEDKDAPFKITNSDMKAFHDRIDTMDTDSITKEIVSRVTKAEENFVKANIKDKENIEKLAEKTKENVDNIKAKDSDTEEELKQEFAAIYRSNVDSIMNRKKSILESIVLRMSKAIISESTLLKNFTQENGKLDMQRIIDSSEVMYTFLEMVNTLNIKPITTTYISEALASIK